MQWIACFDDALIVSNGDVAFRERIIDAQFFNALIELVLLGLLFFT